MIWTSGELQSEEIGASNYELGSQDLGSRPGPKPRSDGAPGRSIGFDPPIYNPESQGVFSVFWRFLAKLKLVKSD